MIDVNEWPATGFGIEWKHPVLTGSLPSFAMKLIAWCRSAAVIVTVGEKEAEELNMAPKAEVSDISALSSSICGPGRQSCHGSDDNQ